MTEPIRINCKTPANVPNINDIRQMADDKHHVVLQFPRNAMNDHVKQSMIATLGGEMPDHSVFYSGGDQKTECITVMPVVKNEIIHMHFEEIKKACAAYINTCATLVNEYQRQTLLKEWKAEPHAPHIRFENIRTGQVVEAPERIDSPIGQIDPYFFAQFVKSTSEWSDVASIIKHDFHDARRMVDILSQKV